MLAAWRRSTLNNIKVKYITCPEAHDQLNNFFSSEVQTIWIEMLRCKNQVS